MDRDTETPNRAPSEPPYISDEITAVERPLARRRLGRGTLSPTLPVEYGETDAPSSVAVAASQLPITAAATRGTAPAVALRQEEVERTRAFLLVILALITTVAGSLPFVGGHSIAKLILGIGLITMAGHALWQFVRLRDPSKYTTPVVTGLAAHGAAVAFTGNVFWGVFSAAPMVFVLGIYFFSLGGNRRATHFLYGLCATLQGVASAVFIADLIPDPGLISASNMTVTQQIMAAVLTQVVFLCAFAVARSSRRTMENALSGLERATKSVALREALLAEARQDLDRARRVGGPGRYTHQTIGSFTLGRLIGRGGMGEVYEAQHDATGDQAAVKLLHPHILASPDHLRRFVKETEIAASLDVPNVVTVLETGTSPGQVPYLAMELLQGRSLSVCLRNDGLSQEEVVDLVVQVANGLEAASAVGIVHRDIKPQNIFRVEHKQAAVWKILDFGVSKLAGDHGTLTQGRVVGTPSYMAPEQARGEQVDPVADVYALAALTYRALTRFPPFSRADVPATLYDVVYRMPARPSSIVDISSEVDYVLALGLAKAPANRFQSAREFATAFAAALKGHIDDDVKRRAQRVLKLHPWLKRR